MKKIYNYILPVLFTVFAASCDGDDEEVIRMQNQDPVVTVTSVSDAVGYVGNEFTIYGTNFGIIANDVEVFVGNTKLQLISCEDEELTVRVPEGTTAGRISVVVYGQRVDTQLMYDVLGVPGIRTVIPSYGFVGDEIKFNGHDLGVPSAHYKVLFSGKEESATFMAEPEMESFSVKVPEGAQSGEIKLNITDKPVNVPVAFTVLKHAALDAVKGEAAGYATGMASVSGTNLNQAVLDETVVLQPVKAFFTPKAGGDAVEAEVKTQEDELLDIQIPATLAPGDYTISVTTPFEKIEKTLDFEILPNPVLTSIEPLKGYVGAVVTVVAENLGRIDKEDIQVMFGETPATDITITGGNTFEVKVPSLTTFGDIPLSMTIHGVEMNMGGYAAFEILASPVITSVETDNKFSSKAVQVGNTVTIKGTGFRNSTISSATFGGQDLNYTVVSDTKITASVSEQCAEGEDVITLKFDDVVVDVVSGDKLNMLKAGSDISDYILTNVKQPFESKEGKTSGHCTPVGWKFNYGAGNDGFCHNESEIEMPGEGLYMNDQGGLLVIQSGWEGRSKKMNGKMFQIFNIPQGIYDVVIDVAELATNGGGRKKAGLFISKGGEEQTPNMDASGNWTENTNLLKSVDFYKLGETYNENYKDRRFVIENLTIDYEGETTLGFAVHFDSNRALKISSIKVLLK